jgi:putative FmdB family regulatory protein
VIDRHLERLEQFLVHAERARENRENRMPRYDYKCPKCGMLMNVIRKIDEPERTPICVNDAIELVRQYDAPPVHLKGTGWGKD